MFLEFGFYEISHTEDILLMENKRDGIDSFVASLARGQGSQGAVVANCNPFTLGHQYLIEQAAKACDTLHLFVLSEDASLFPADVRMELVKKGTAHLPNVLVHPTSDYLISSATFPTYFLKEEQIEKGAGGQLDLVVFGQHFAPALDRSLSAPSLPCITNRCRRFSPGLASRWWRSHGRKKGEQPSAHPGCAPFWQRGRWMK